MHKMIAGSGFIAVDFKTIFGICSSCVKVEIGMCVLGVSAEARNTQNVLVEGKMQGLSSNCK